MSMQPTIDQQRAAYAWKQIEQQQEPKNFANVAKAAPALIMNNGLMQTLAFNHQKGGAHESLNEHIMDWLHQRFKKKIVGTDYKTVMQALHEGDAYLYREATEETMALLRWIRQFAAANS